MKATSNIHRMIGLLRFGVGLYLATTLQAAVVYTFTATTRPSLDSPAHSETFELRLADFIPVVENGGVVSFLSDDPAVVTCSPCVSSPIPALHFLRGSTSDLLQFADADGTTRLFTFPKLVFSQPGSYSTLPLLNTEQGQLTVDGAASPTPEPSTMIELGVGMVLLAQVLRRRRSRLPEHAPLRKPDSKS